MSNQPIRGRFGDKNLVDQVTRLLVVLEREKEMNSGKIICTTVLLGLTVSVTGCAGLVGEGFEAGDRGRILISADTEGMRAFSDMQNAIITNTKAQGAEDTPAWRLRETQSEIKVPKSTGYSTYAGQAEK